MIDNIFLNYLLTDNIYNFLDIKSISYLLSKLFSRFHNKLSKDKY